MSRLNNRLHTRAHSVLVSGCGTHLEKSAMRDPGDIGLSEKCARMIVFGLCWHVLRSTLTRSMADVQCPTHTMLMSIDGRPDHTVQLPAILFNFPSVSAINLHGSVCVRFRHFIIHYFFKYLVSCNCCPSFVYSANCNVCYVQSTKHFSQMFLNINFQ